MSKKKSKEMEPLPKLPTIDISSSKTALADLKKREYSDSAALSYAKAARSWCEKDSAEWRVWKEVEVCLSEKV